MPTFIIRANRELAFLLKLNYCAIMRIFFNIILGLLFFSIVSKAQTLNYYFGNLHAHSAYSDGNKDSATSLMTKPIQDFACANGAQQIDFYGISEHNHYQAGLLYPYYYHNGLADANSSNVDGSFIAMYGMEWGVISGGGHVLVYGYDSLLGWDPNDYDIYVAKNDYHSLWKKINRKPNAFAMLAHPNATDFDSLYLKVYNASYDSAIVGTPFRSGPAFSTCSTYTDQASGTYITQYNDALKLGYHLGIGLDHDTHNSVYGKQNAGRLVIMASSLNRNSLTDAVRSMRFYASDDWNTKVNFTINGQQMGSVVTHSGTATLSLTVTDPNSENTSNITVYYGVPGSGTAPTVLTSITNNSTLTFTHNLSNNSSYYYYAKITQSDGDLIYTSPIWYKRNDAVNIYPPVASYSISGTTTKCTGQTFTLTNTSTNTPTSYVWYMPGANPSTSTLQNPSISYSTPGIKNITLIASNASGSGTQITKTISINVCTEVEEKEILDSEIFSFYPNPTNDNITLKFGKSTEAYTITITDLLGKEYITKHVSQTDTELINTSDLSEGVYLIRCQTQNASIAKKVIIKH